MFHVSVACAAQLSSDIFDRCGVCQRTSCLSAAFHQPVRICWRVIHVLSFHCQLFSSKGLAEKGMNMPMQNAHNIQRSHTVARLTLTCSCHTHSLTLTLTHTHIHTCTYIHTHSLMHTHTHTDTPMLAHNTVDWCIFSLFSLRLWRECASCWVYGRTSVLLCTLPCLRSVLRIDTHTHARTPTHIYVHTNWSAKHI